MLSAKDKRSGKLGPVIPPAALHLHELSQNILPVT